MRSLLLQSTRLAAIVAALLTLPAHAHEPGLSSASFRLTPTALEAVVTFAVADIETLVLLDTDEDGKVTPLEFTYARDQVKALATEVLAVTVDGQPASPAAPNVTLDDMNNVEFKLQFPARADVPITIQSRLVSRLPAGHKQFCTAHDQDNRPLVERLLDAKDDRVHLNDPNAPATAGATAAASPTAATFGGFLLLGIEHILVGYDHLLFLFALLIVSKRFASTVQIITCFTLAHSLTLAAATLNWVQFPGRIVEPLIAASIVYVGVENLIRGDDPKGRWLLTFGFGLVHGFGFASVLRDLGIASGSGGVVLPLLAFNLGVEAGQILVAAVLLPLLWKLRGHPAFVSRWVPACSVLVAAAGGYWLVERVWGN